MTVAIPAGVIIAWSGTVASIPAGWARVAALDGRHPKGAAAGLDPNVSGGSPTHAHVPTAHSHSEGAHTHSGPTSGGADRASQLGGSPVVPGTHTHTGGTSGSSSGTSSAELGAWAAESSDPDTLDVIFIASDGTPVGVPAGGWVLSQDNPLPTGWTLAATAADRFLKGAPTGSDGGATYDASTHAHTGVAHTHAFNAHTHTGGTSGAASPSSANVGQSGSGALLNYELDGAHTHAYAFLATGTQSGSASSASSGAAAYEPPWVKLAVAQNDTTGEDAPLGIICAWLGTLASIPNGWGACDGANGTPDLRDTFIKGAASLGEIGDTGGALGHSHASPAAHSHAYDHTHTESFLSASSMPSGALLSLAVGGFTLAPHAHSATSGSATGTSGTGVQDAPSGDSQPAYRTVLWIMLLDRVEVAIAYPADGGTVTAPGFTASWGLTDGKVQNDYRLRVYSDLVGTVVYDSGVVASANTAHTLPDSGILTNGVTYYLDVLITTDAGIVGRSAVISFTTAWTPPTIIAGLRATAITGEVGVQP